MKLINAISRRTIAILNEKGYTQHRLCKEGGLPKGTISHLVNATKGDVKMSTIWEIADTLGMTLKEFFDDPLFDEIDD